MHGLALFSSLFFSLLCYYFVDSNSSFQSDRYCRADKMILIRIRWFLMFKVLETVDLLGEVTETVDYYVQGSTMAAGNLIFFWVDVDVAVAVAVAARFVVL
ncbi:hypothetical protein Droror1_Dr00011197 [Drosera rotundifolia]